MGTRNLTCVIYGGQTRLAKYGQWDGGLNSLGKNMTYKLNVKGRTPDPDICVEKVLSWIESRYPTAQELTLNKNSDGSLYKGVFGLTDGGQVKVQLTGMTYLNYQPIALDKPKTSDILAAQ